MQYPCRWRWLSSATLLFGIISTSTLAARDASSAEPAFAGRWDLTVMDSAGHDMPSWLELSRNQGSWTATFVGRWGNARRLPKVEIQGERIQFVSPRNEEGSTNDLIFRGTLTGASSQGDSSRARLEGVAVGANGSSWTWIGRHAPALRPPPNPKWGSPATLFNGRDFSGWYFDNPAKSSSWVVDKGCLVNRAAGSNIATEGKFRDFKLHIEVNCPTNANSGIYLRGRYEVQVEDDSLPEPPSHHMGAVYGFLAPVPEQPRRPGVWQSFDITLLGRFVTVVQNGSTIIDRQEIPGITGGAFDSREESPGPIYLQGDHGGIAYRNIVLTPAVP